MIVTVIAVFSGTSSAIMNYTIQTNFFCCSAVEQDGDLEEVPPSRDLQDDNNYEVLFERI